MSFKDFLRKLFSEEEKDNSLEIALGLFKISNRLKGATYQVDGKTFFDLRSIATNFGGLEIIDSDSDSNKRKARSYLRTLNKGELWKEFEQARFTEDCYSNTKFNLSFPDSDNPNLFYMVNASDYRFWVQEEIVSRF